MACAEPYSVGSTGASRDILSAPDERARVTGSVQCFLRAVRRHLGDTEVSIGQQPGWRRGTHGVGPCYAYGKCEQTTTDRLCQYRPRRHGAEPAEHARHDPADRHDGFVEWPRAGGA